MILCCIIILLMIIIIILISLFVVDKNHNDNDAGLTGALPRLPGGPAGATARFGEEMYRIIYTYLSLSLSLSLYIYIYIYVYIDI